MGNTHEAYLFPWQQSAIAKQNRDQIESEWDFQRIVVFYVLNVSHEARI